MKTAGEISAAGTNRAPSDPQRQRSANQESAGDGYQGDYSKFMTSEELADYLRVARTTIHRLLKRNEIPAFRIGRRWRFDVEEVKKWYASHTLKSEPQRSRPYSFAAHRN